MKRILAGALALIVGTLAGAAERRDLATVSIPSLINETQQMRDQDGTLAVVWWIPIEFWMVSALTQGWGTPAALQELRTAFEDYLVIGVVEGKPKALGGVDFLAQESVASRLRVQVGNARFRLVERPNKDAQLLTESVKPVLASMLGDMGKHFHILLLSSDSRKPPSAYEAEILRVTLAAAEGTASKTFEFEAPLDAMHLPRTCPNGRPAHVSWKYCPWDGTRLPD